MARIESDILQNPVSLIGSAKRIIPLGGKAHGWLAVATRTGVILLLILAWAGVLLWYVLLCVPLFFGWVPWAIWTLNRRHHIHDVGRAAMQADFNAGTRQP
jgi:hypothetical protein